MATAADFGGVPLAADVHRRPLRGTGVRVRTCWPGLHLGPTVRFQVDNLSFVLCLAPNVIWKFSKKILRFELGDCRVPDGADAAFEWTRYADESNGWNESFVVQSKPLIRRLASWVLMDRPANGQKGAWWMAAIHRSVNICPRNARIISMNDNNVWCYF